MTKYKYTIGSDSKLAILKNDNFRLLAVKTTILWFCPLMVDMACLCQYEVALVYGRCEPLQKMMWTTRKLHLSKGITIRHLPEELCKLLQRLDHDHTPMSS